MSNVLVKPTDSVVTGTAGDNQFVAADGSYIIKGSHTLVGQGGNDSFAVEGMNVKVVEQPNTNNSWITSENSYVLPANVKNLTVWGSNAAFGNDDGNTIFAQGAGSLIDGGKGDDILVGGVGTRYQFEAGSNDDVITQWSPTSVLRLGGYSQYKSFADVQSSIKQVGSDVLVQLDATDSIRIQNTRAGDLTAANFQFHLDASKLGAMTFDDEFNSLSTRVRGGTIGVWDTEGGAGATSDALDARTLQGNNEKELYVDPTFKGTGSTSLGLNPFSISNGVLTINEAPMPTADKAAAYNYGYTSGVISSRDSFAQTYGYFEARMQVPTGQGTWPAFWLLRQDGTWPPELDVLEGYGDNVATETIHTQQTGTHTADGTANFVPNADTGFHTYGVLWTPTTLTWYIDGVAVKQAPTPADMHSPMYMIINNAVSPNVTDPNLTSQTKIDYVRAYGLADVPTTVLGSAAIHGGAYTDATDATSPSAAPVSTTSTSGASTTATTPAAATGAAAASKTDHGYWGKNPALADGFNAEYYAAHNPDVVAAGMDMHTHYLKYGKAEGRLAYDPDASDAAAVSSLGHGYWGAIPGLQDGFNAAYYTAHNPDVVKAGVDLLTHYETYGKAEGRLAYDPTAVAPSGSVSGSTTITSNIGVGTPVSTVRSDHGYWGKNPAMADGFNYEYYRALNPDVVKAGMDLHTHYLKYGKAEGRLPYDPDATDAAAVSSIGHGYWGAIAGVQDGFNAAYYMAHNPDVVQAGMDPLTHYETYGKSEGRLAYDPTAVAPSGTNASGPTPDHGYWGKNPAMADGFNYEYYGAHNPDVVKAGMDLHTHYLRFGKAEGRLPYDPDAGDAATVSAADHGYWGKNPAMADGFNYEYYGAHNPDVVKAGMDLHTHYLRYGQAEGRLPYAPDAGAASASAAGHGYWGAVSGAQDGFNAAYYAAHNPDVVKAGMDLLTHYETYGKTEGRLAFDPSVTSHAYWGAVTGVQDGFNAAFYAAHNLDVVASGMNLLTHYETYGKAEGRPGYDPAAGTAADGTTAASYTTIAAASGNATLAGTSASDTFRLSPGFGVDTVTNFDVAHDKLDVSKLLAKYGNPTLTDTADHLGTIAHWSGGETLQLLGVSHTDAQHALGF